MAQNSSRFRASPLGQTKLRRQDVEAPTWALLTAAYAGWMALTWFWADLPLLLILPALAYLTSLHASLQHEALHGHPTRSALANEALVFPALNPLFPYRRFRTLHLRHHNDEKLTDPYDDPESYYLAEGDWARLSAPLRLVLEFNNTLIGRLTIGPAVLAVGFLAGEARRIAAGDRQIRLAWLLHGAGLAIVLVWLVAAAKMPVWLYLAGVAYPALSLQLLRTFAEHQASEEVGKRSVIVEASPVLALLFLNNNLHFVHHSHPRTPWYRLPAVYRAGRKAFRQGNGGYVFPGYAALFRRFALRQRDTVAHPFLRRG